MKYLAVLGRQPKISLAELESLFSDVKQVAPELAEFSAEKEPEISRLGGTLKLAKPILEPIPKFWEKLPDSGKIVVGVSDFSKGTNAYLAQKEAMKWKRVLSKTGRNVRVVPNKTPVLSSATSLHNKLFTATHVEIIKNGKYYYRVIGVQDIEAYAKRDQARPARDAKVGMLPPKLAQILINLCGVLPEKSVVLDPFCGTGVVLQEAVLMGYQPYGTDINERMVEYAERNLEWLTHNRLNSFFSATRRSSGPSLRAEAASPSGRCPADGLRKEQIKPTSALVAKSSEKVPKPSSEDKLSAHQPILVTQGDATNFEWQPPIDAVACETYLGRPMSLAPADIKLKQEKQECGTIVLGFLKNLASQIQPETPVTIAVPAWLRPNWQYERLNILDEIEELGYNVKRFRNVGQEDLLYHREKQVVAREIIVLRKK